MQPHDLLRTENSNPEPKTQQLLVTKNHWLALRRYFGDFASKSLKWKAARTRVAVDARRHTRRQASTLLHRVNIFTDQCGAPLAFP